MQVCCDFMKCECGINFIPLMTRQAVQHIEVWLQSHLHIYKDCTADRNQLEPNARGRGGLLHARLD